MPRRSTTTTPAASASSFNSSSLRVEAFVAARSETVSFTVFKHPACFNLSRAKAPMRDWYLVSDLPTSISLTPHSQIQLCG